MTTRATGGSVLNWEKRTLLIPRLATRLPKTLALLSRVTPGSSIIILKLPACPVQNDLNSLGLPVESMTVPFSETETEESRPAPNTGAAKNAAASIR